MGMICEKHRNWLFIGTPASGLVSDGRRRAATRVARHRWGRSECGENEMPKKIQLSFT
jgi:hypothetical protein